MFLLTFINKNFSMFFYFPLVYVYSLSFIFGVVYFCCSVLFFKSGSHSVAHSGLEFIIELLQPSLPGFQDLLKSLLKSPLVFTQF